MQCGVLLDPNRFQYPLSVYAVTHQASSWPFGVGLSVNICDPNLWNVSHIAATSRTPVGGFSANSAC